MIVPRSRLLFWVAMVVLPFSLLAAVEPSAVAVSFGFMGALAALALADALMARRGLAGIELHLPEVVRMSRNRDAKVEMRIRNERQQPQTLRLALALPGGIQSEQAEIEARLPGASEWSRLEWVCRPARRGRYQVSERGRRLAAGILGIAPPAADALGVPRLSKPVDGAQEPGGVVSEPRDVRVARAAAGWEGAGL
jgi:hypothetical protein